MATLLKTILCSFALLMLLVSAKFTLEHHLAPSSSGIQGELRQPGVDILLVGSSHTRQGYDAALLEQMTGQRVFIVAYDGLDAAGMLPLVKTLLADPARRPKLLVLEANSANLARAPDIQEPRLFFDAPPAMKWALIQSYLHSHHGETAYIDVWTLAANRGSELILTYPFLYKAIDNLSYHGSYLHKDLGGLDPQTFATLSIPLTRSAADADQQKAWRELLAFAAADHVQLLLAEPPMPASVEAQPVIVSLQQQFKAMAGAENIPYYQGAVGFPCGNPALFHDSNHLSTAGREQYTAGFAEILRAQISRNQ